MAIVEMSKITLIGVSVQKKEILDCLFASKLVELSNNIKPLPNTSSLFNQNNYETLDLYCSKLERAILSIEENLPLDAKIENVFDMSVEDFENLENKKPEVELVLHELDLLQIERNENKKEKTNLENRLSQLIPYKEVNESFSSFKNTKHTTIALGVIPRANLKEFKEFLKECYSKHRKMKWY